MEKNIWCTMTRKGGNPDLEKFKFQCKISDEPAENFSVRLPPGSKNKLIDKYGKDYLNVVREAIAELLDDHTDD
jgi:hypothetical protein